MKSPIPFNGTYKDIEKIANEVEISLDLNDKIAIDRTKALDVGVKSLGGKYTNYKSFNGELLEIRSKEDFTIYMPSLTSNTYDNFKIAQSLGHLFLHYNDELGTIIFNRYAKDTIADQANCFAYELLLPRRMFMAEYEKYKDKPYLIAGSFGVNENAILYRAKYLMSYVKNI